MTPDLAQAGLAVVGLQHRPRHPGEARRRPPRRPRRRWPRRRCVASRKAVASASRSRLDVARAGAGTSAATPAERAPAPSSPVSRRTTRDPPCGQVAGPDLDAHGHALAAPSRSTRRPKLTSARGVELRPARPARGQLGGELLGRLAGAVLVPHEQHDGLGRAPAAAAARRPPSSPWAMISPPIIRVLDAPRRLPDVLQGARSRSSTACRRPWRSSGPARGWCPSAGPCRRASSPRRPGC